MLSTCGFNRWLKPSVLQSCKDSSFFESDGVARLEGETGARTLPSTKVRLAHTVLHTLQSRARITTDQQEFIGSVRVSRDVETEQC